MAFRFKTSSLLVAAALLAGPWIATAITSAANAPDPVEFARLDSYSEGPVFDYEGNLYVAHLTVGKIRVLSPDGRLLRSLPAGNSDASNLAWGGTELNQLFITGSIGHRSRAPGRVFRLKLDGVRGISSLSPRESASAGAGANSARPPASSIEARERDWETEAPAALAFLRRQLQPK